MTYNHLDTCIKRQAIKINQQDEIFVIVEELLEAGRTKEARQVLASHNRKQEFKG